MRTLLVVCSVVILHGVRGDGDRSDGRVYTTAAQASCRYSCGSHMGSCSCSSSCQYYGNCCRDYNYYCSNTTPQPETTAQASCRYSCGSHMGSCSCSSSCQYYGNCCRDYNYYCSNTTPQPQTTAQASCRYSCGSHMGSCSCSSSCQYYGNCCRDYNYYCSNMTPQPQTTAQASCRYSCGSHMGSCSCSSSCRYYGNCCRDYNYYCSNTTPQPETTAQASCRYSCGSHMGSCSCSSSCQYYGNCCRDYNYYCNVGTSQPWTTDMPSCRYNCGGNLGSCSCSSSCQYYGNCCPDYYSHCYSTSAMPTTEGPCGGSMFGSGAFSSPSHPDDYQNNAYCVWHLRSLHNQRVLLEFSYLQLQGCCSCDYISIYDGPSVSSPYLGKFCNDGNNNDSFNFFYSTSNHMTVVFRSDGSVVGRGFRAEFTSALPQDSGQVNCSSDDMNIVIGRKYLNSLGYEGHSLYLNDQYCRPEIFQEKVVFNFPVNRCGTSRKFENGKVVYTNTLRGYTSSYGDITRKANLKIEVVCRMDPSAAAQIMYLAQNHDNVSITGTGTFNTSMDLYSSSNFNYKVTEFPYKVSLNQDLYVQVDLRSSMASYLDIFLDTCVASPSSDDFHTTTYFLVRNGCPVDNTYQSYVSGSRQYARFSFKAFQFLRRADEVYIRCKVLICQDNDWNSRCRRGCVKRRKRNAGDRHKSRTLVLGPIQLIDPDKNEKGSAKEEAG
ncbi:deleted in malignant brain tumors 1 protein isoform X6 [Hippocampus zosterae]|uniref:deleted in malignant brain tumors 1 protein isoform X6 n=1 Tax=Hippocampus zosterae TaxID=109293 RepID=UPI00223CF355|nr:deleted in malignant brain tumors 1 protein isoform X6 [Hippocampus zosterae]